MLCTEGARMGILSRGIGFARFGVVSLLLNLWSALTIASPRCSAATGARNRSAWDTMRSDPYGHPVEVFRGDDNF